MKGKFKPVPALLLAAVLLCGGFGLRIWAADTDTDADTDDNGSPLISTYTDMANLLTYVDGSLSGELSGLGVAGETWTLTAPDVEGKTFSHWALNAADGTVVSTRNPYRLAVYVNTALYAVYTTGTPEQSGSRVAFTALAATNYIGSDVLRMTATYSLSDGSVADEVGVVYASNQTLGLADPTENLLTDSAGAGGTALLKSGENEQTHSYSGAGSGAEGDWTLFLIPPTDDGYVYAVPFVKTGAATLWGDPVAVRYSELDTGVIRSANFSLKGLPQSADQGEG